jgi:cardiolipin synthase
MTNPYIGDPKMIADIIEAGRRGVAVRLLVSDEAHGGVAAAAFKHHYDALIEAGVQVWEYPALVHAKVILSDDRALVGTLNLDAWAMYRNPELGLLFEDASVADQFRTVMIDPDVTVSKAGAAATGGLRRTKNRILARASYLF